MEGAGEVVALRDRDTVSPKGVGDAPRDGEMGPGPSCSKDSPGKTWAAQLEWWQ